MRVDTEVVEYVAALARISVSEEERPLLAEQLSSILTHVDKLRELDTSAIAPTATVVSSQTVTREDVALPSCPTSAVLENAPDRQDDQFRVDAVLDQ